MSKSIECPSCKSLADVTICQYKMLGIYADAISNLDKRLEYDSQPDLEEMLDNILRLYYESIALIENYWGENYEL